MNNESNDDSGSGNELVHEPLAGQTISNGKLTAMDDGLVSLLSIFEPQKSEALEQFHLANKQDVLFEACKQVGKALGIHILKPPFTRENVSIAEYIEDVTDASQCRSRLETLNFNWWERDCGPLIGFKAEDNSPVAFLQKNNRYVIFDPLTQTSSPMNATVADTFSQSVYRLYKALPNEALGWWDIFKFTFGDLKKDIQKIFILQLYVGLLALLIPIVTGIIFDTLIPNADMHHLSQIILLLCISTVVSTAFGLAQAFYIMRIRFRTDITLQSATWDRVLRLPLTFFNQFLSGDLATRVRGVDAIQQFITSTMLTTLLSGLFSILSVALMFVYDVWLALAGVGLAIIAVFISLGFNLIQVRYQRPLIAMLGKMSGTMFQLLLSINKLRVANSEKEAFGVWAKIFTTKNKLFMSAQLNMILFGIFYPFFAVFSTIIIFSLVILRGEELSFGHFIAFNAAFGQFMGALLAMASVINQLIMIIPYYERIKPILKTVPEMENQGLNPGVLTGNLTLKHVSFRYHSEMPYVLEDISIQVKAGSFIALVGPSGSGKSTLFRLLLGFEEIKKDSIFYDEHDLFTLNKKALRKQLGVVTQNTLLLPGSIFESITGQAPNLTLKDAEEAARLMGILDEIRAMPMGMHTWIAEGGRNISVGQRQRILLAHAIIHKPRLLLLDEATSALDNKTQATIHDNLKLLNITRLVAAHRLSMVKDADNIYVLDKGRIVQNGTYDQLLAMPGLFSQLAERQLL